MATVDSTHPRPRRARAAQAKPRPQTRSLVVHVETPPRRRRFIRADVVDVPFEPMMVEDTPSPPPIRLGKRPRRRIEEDTRTAFHEAGHAVLMHALGIGCTTVTIVPDYDEMTAGSASHGGEFGKRARHPGEEDDDVATLRFAAEDAFLLRHAIAYYAGAEAERRHNPRLKDWKAMAEEDERKAAYRVSEISMDDECIDLLLKYARRRCVLLVENYWPEITAVAQLLLEQRTLTGEQVKEAFRASLNGREGACLMHW
jgi:hypothetical protein